MSICTMGCCSEGRTFIPDRGNIYSPICFVGENPGFEEVKALQPFVGRAGRKLMEFIAAAGLDLADCYFTNTVHCREEGRKPAKPYPHEVDNCHKLLIDTFKVITPKAVVLLGNTAIEPFYPGWKVGRIHGTLRQFDLGDGKSTTLIPTYHPSAVLHGNHEIIPMIVEDIAKCNVVV